MPGVLSFESEETSVRREGCGGADRPPWGESPRAQLVKDCVIKKWELCRKLYDKICASKFESGHFCNVLIRFWVLQVLGRRVCGRGIMRDAVIEAITVCFALLWSMHVLAVGHLYGGAIWGLFSNVYDNTKGRRRQVREDNNKLSSLRALWLLLEDGAPTVGRGKNFWAFNQIFLTKTAVTPERKVGKSFPDGKWTVTQMADILGPKKTHTLLQPNHVLAMTGKSCSKKKVAFSQIIINQNIILGNFLG